MEDECAFHSSLTNSHALPFQISKNDTLPQQVCVNCAKTAISACLFKKKCEDADNFYRQQLLIKKIEEGHSGSGSGNELKPEDATVKAREEGTDEAQVKRRSSASAASSSSSGSGSGSSSSGSGSSSSSSDDDDDEDNETNPNPNHNANANANGQVEEHVTRAQNGHGQLNGNLAEHEQQEAEEGNEDAMERQQQQRQQLDEEGALEQRLEQQQQQQQQERHEDGEMPEHLAFNSIRLMQEYMQQRMNKFPNGGSRGSTGHLPDAMEHELEHELYEQQRREHEHDGDEDDEDDDEEMSLPLIPEIELITPSDDASGMLAGAGNDTDGGHGLPNGVGSITGAGVGVGGVGGAGGPVAAAGMLHGGVAGGGMRGFQCPHCFLIFEMKQILKAHMQSVHGAPGPVYECTNCRKTYFYKRFLEKHIRRGRCVKKRRNQT